MEIRYKPLPDKLFMVRVPAICSYTEEEVNIYGLPVDTRHASPYWSERNYEKAYNNITTCMLPISKLIDIYSNGYPISLVNQSDVPIMYEILEEYLSGVVYANSTNMLNAARIEEDRLDHIEKFASEMFGLNKGNIVKNIVDLDNTQAMVSGLDLMSPQSINTKYSNTTFNPNAMPTKQTSYPMKQEEIPVHHNPIRPSMGDSSSYAFVYNNVPDFNIDKIERKSSYRKRFKPN